jgi:UV DNA damage endonuclease
MAEPIRYRTTRATILKRFLKKERLAKASALCLHNMESLKASIEAVVRLGIGAFRVQSGLFPRATHPEVGYALSDLLDKERILALAREVRSLAKKHGVRLSLHPDQFVSLSSAKPAVTDSSVRELEFQGLLAELIGAETITLHGGGAEGGKEAALARLRKGFGRLSRRVRRRLALENDDRVYTPSDLLPLCRKLGIPMVYDCHHHRCLPDGLSLPEASRAAAATWRRLSREPYFHVSSPKYGWNGRDPRPHSDYIDPLDFPKAWLAGRLTVDVEAKAKELAVLALRERLPSSR